jgi:hypothetical protein
MGRWNPDAIERQLGHEDSNAVRRAYTHAAEYWTERVAMMQVWADYLDELCHFGEVVSVQSDGPDTAKIRSNSSLSDTSKK